MYPLKLTAVLKDYIWGGNRLKDEYGLSTELTKVAEAWVLSSHKDGENIVQNGKYKGLTLREVIKKEGKKCLGLNAQGYDEFPILIKLIDAKDNLSIQVHPNDEQARELENQQGKTEAWLILDCDENSSLVYGFNKVISKDEFRKSIEDDTILSVLKTVPVAKGDVFFIQAGTVHAIGKGILLAEIQQNSNVTYRVYDYGRLGDNGRPRDLHIEKALKVVNYTPENLNKKSHGSPHKFEFYTITPLVTCELFIVNRIEISKKVVRKADETSFVSLLALEGEGFFEWAGEKQTFNKGESIFVPANSGEFTIMGELTVLETRI